jgi:hypothetical protein
LAEEDMNLVGRIEELIVGESEGFFDDPSDREDLHTNIRIAAAFHKFLVEATEKPSAEDIMYVMDTIRSGIDQLFHLANSCHIITGCDKWHLDRHAYSGFAEIREAFLRHFASFTRDEASVTERLASAGASGARFCGAGLSMG